MSLLKPYVSSSLIKPVLDAYLHQHGRLSVLADAIAVTDLWFFEPPEKIAMEQYFKLLLKASELVNDPHLGIRVGQHTGLASFDILGKALENIQKTGQKNNQKKNATLAKALQQVIVLERLVHRLGDSRIEMEGENVRVIWRAQYQQHRASRLVSESVFSGIIHLAHSLAGRLIPILDVTFVHAKPSVYSELIYQQAYRSQCRFDQKYNSLLLAADVLAWPLQQSIDTSSELVEKQSISELVMAQLKPSLMSSPKLSQIAAILGINERSLQRKLKAEGCSYQQLLAEARLQQACDYLYYSSLNTLNISQLLGFKEQSSFNHFFIQQTGMSPLRYKSQKTATTS
jgi:AraC-like DNA-binding protein